MLLHFSCNPHVQASLSSSNGRAWMDSEDAADIDWCFEPSKRGFLHQSDNRDLMLGRHSLKQDGCPHCHSCSKACIVAVAQHGHRKPLLWASVPSGMATFVLIGLCRQVSLSAASVPVSVELLNESLNLEETGKLHYNTSLISRPNTDPLMYCAWCPYQAPWPSYQSNVFT